MWIKLAFEASKDEKNLLKIIRKVYELEIDKIKYDEN